MLFSTPFFLFVFLPLFFALYRLLPMRRAILLLGSLVFYAWAEPIFIWIVFFSAFLDYQLGRQICRPTAPDRQRRLAVAAGVLNNLGLLAVVKYGAFFCENANAMLSALGVPHLPVPNFLLPLGISFIVFEKITYVVDLLRGLVKPAASFFDYLNYVFLFPKLLAGPIVKYHDIAAQLTRPSHRYEDLRDGSIRFAQGLAKKVLLADPLALFADPVFALPVTSLDSTTAWLGLIAFTLQIYFDFSGYSDMAIGMARVLGFRLRENFNHPYLASSFSDFWRRWHISLSSWIKEYLYIPLGGNRVSTARGYVNLCICFLLSGLWHGASWNFVIWGCSHGLVLVADRAFWLEWQKRLPHSVNVAITFLLVMMTWVFFRCDTFGHALGFFRALGGQKALNPNFLVPEKDTLAIMLIGVFILLLPVLRKLLPARSAAPGQTAALALSVCLLLCCVARITVGAFHPFLYFRF